MMNEAFQAKAGLESDLFPDTIPTYTGHYHKPHTVADTNITYIGSPYQGTSAGCLDCALAVKVVISTASKCIVAQTICHDQSDLNMSCMQH